MTQSVPPQANQCPAYILAGGKNSRFGDDKALVEIAANEYQLTRLLRTLAEFGHPAYVVADRKERYKTLGIECLVDECPGLGPMAAIVTAARHRSNLHGDGWLLLINVDQVRWTMDWFQQLNSRTSQDLLAVTFRQQEIDQPIPALYHSNVSEPAAKALAAGGLSLRTLLRTIPSATIEPATNPRDWSFNTREDLDRILRQL